MEITPEQARLQEITATQGTPGWQYLVEDWENRIKELEEAIHDLNIDDTPRYSLRGLFVVQANSLRTVKDTPERLATLYKSIEK